MLSRNPTQELPPHRDILHPAPSAPAVPRAASVTSARSSTRRHRHARSHHGGSSVYTPQNEFPVFSNTGDVEIIISNASGRKENRYVLHRLILSQCSGFFEASTREAWNRAEDTKGLATIGENDVTRGSRASSQDRSPSYENGRKRWKYVLDWQHAGTEETPMLVQDISAPSIFGGDSSIDRPPFSRNKPPPSNQDFFRSMSDFSALSVSTDRPQRSIPADPGDEVLKDYDNLFRTMYQHAPVLDSLNIATAYTESKALLHLADMYDALEIVGSRVDHHLLRFGARLFKQIAKYPPSYLKIAYLARSRTIFTESLIHVVGQWPLAAPQLKNHIDVGVLDLIEDKVDDLEEIKARIEAKLWRLTLTTPRGDRVTPANDYLSWLAMSLFRQWVAENSTPLPPSNIKDPSSTQIPSRSSNHAASQRLPPAETPPPPIGRFYRLLGSTSTSAYLNHDELKRFLKLQPDLYTRENLRRFERRIEEMKALAREAVRPLMRNFLELDLTIFGPAGLGYLTCTKIDERDLPWDE